MSTSDQIHPVENDWPKSSRMSLCEAMSSALRVLDIEAQAILSAKNRSVDDSFFKALVILYSCSGKIVMTGIGKSGWIARKLVSTFSSLGNPSVFLHPAEAAHGDLGLLSRNDVLVFLSQSGKTSELLVVLEFALRIGIPIIGFTADSSGALARMSTVVINTWVQEEACFLNLAPTASSTLTLALGDALAVTLSQMKGFTARDFKTLHPGGRLGKKLLKVSDLMRSGDEFPCLPTKADLKSVLLTMSRGEVRGICAVVDPENRLVGVVTDGDLRRKFDQVMRHPDPRAEHIMTCSPITIQEDDWAVRALSLMEEKRINALVVMNVEGFPIGVIHLQDVVRSLNS